MSLESDFFLEYTPDVVLDRLARCAALSLAAAQQEAARFPDFVLDVTPTLRRLSLQQALLLSTYCPGVSVDAVRHQGGSHIEIVTDRVTITNLTRSQMPWSVASEPYRKTLATDAQYNLFSDPEEQVNIGNEARLYALFLFGGAPGSRRLSLCRIAFPTPKGKFAPGYIDLLVERHGIITAFDDEEYAKRQVEEFASVVRAQSGDDE